MKLQAFLIAVMVGSTIVHELGHVAAGWWWGYRVVGVRWLPPGVHLRGPRGKYGVAPRVECLAVALGGPCATIATTAVVWSLGLPFCAFLWALCGLSELAIPWVNGTDWNQIITALFKAER